MYSVEIVLIHQPLYGAVSGQVALSRLPNQRTQLQNEPAISEIAIRNNWSSKGSDVKP
jgi:hypothetical protein